MICALLVALVVTSSTVTVGRASNGTTIAQGEKIAIPFLVNNYTLPNNWTIMVVGLSKDPMNGQWLGNDISGNPTSQSGVQLGMYADIASGSQVLSSMSSGKAWVELTYIGDTTTKNMTVHINIAENESELFGSGSVDVLVQIVFTASSGIEVISQPSVGIPIGLIVIILSGAVMGVMFIVGIFIITRRVGGHTA
jgi:hypothetical protein